MVSGGIFLEVDNSVINLNAGLLVFSPSSINLFDRKNRGSPRHKASVPPIFPFIPRPHEWGRGAGVGVELIQLATKIGFQPSLCKC
jgi:hypothetical protein